MGQNLNAGLPDHKAKLYLLTHDIWLIFIQVLRHPSIATLNITHSTKSNLFC